MDQVLLTSALAGFGLMMLVTVVSDIASRTIPDTVPLSLLGMVPLLAFGLPRYELTACLLTGVAVFAAGLLLFRCGWLGGGDVKLVTAIAVWAGPAHLLPFLIEMSIAGGLLTAGMLAHRLVQTAPAGEEAPLQVPYGIAIAVAGAGLMIRLAHDGGLLTPSV